MTEHIPVLLNEVKEFLNPAAGGRFIDATLGGGGHTRVILESTAPDGRVLAIDQDESALSRAKETLRSFGSRVIFVHSNFRAARIRQNCHFTGKNCEKRFKMSQMSRLCLFLNSSSFVF